MVDLHSHVLFEIDDGSESIEESVEILKKAQSSGIKKMMVTPHFTIGEDVQEFVDRRNRRLLVLKEAAGEEGIALELKAGAEVYITDELFNEDRLDLLCFEDSNVMLSEFKYHALRGDTLLGYVDEIQSRGIKMLVAHPERYSYLMNDVRLLEALVRRNVILQVNAISLFEESEEGEFARFLLKNNLAGVVASDIHHPSSKRLAAMKKLGEMDTDYIVRATETVPEKIFEGVF